MSNTAPALNAVMWREIFERYRTDGRNLQNQIRTMIVEAILDGRLPANSEVPSSRELSEALGVARNTVVLAYQQLVAKGYLVTRDRSGHRVNPEMAKPSGLQAPKRAEPARAQVVPINHRAPDWTSRLQLSVGSQRNIVKRSDWQKLPYPFLYGQFDASLFPTAEWRECCMKALSVGDIREWAQDLILHDDEALINEICTKVLPRRGVWATPDQVVVTVGAQNALYMIADLLFSETTRVGMENPCYPDARNIFSLKSGKIVPIDVDDQGLPVDDRLDGCDYVYVTPSHQCPTATKMSVERREALLRAAEQHDFVIVEDDYEAESVFGENPSPALKSSDRSGRVLYVGSLSKTFAPGLRLGYLVGPTPIISELRGLRRLMVRHPSAFIQRAFALFISLGHLDAMVRKQTVIYRQRAMALQEALARHMPEFEVYPSHGGSSLWVRGPRGLDARWLAEQAEKVGVLIECGDVFFEEPAPREFFRLGFSAINVERIESGIELLAKVSRG
ncbi:PLP-dependent aminotransferase family protein [beta proteobacterium MWH-UniP1]